MGRNPTIEISREEMSRAENKMNIRNAQDLKSLQSIVEKMIDSRPTESIREPQKDTSKIDVSNLTEIIDDARTPKQKDVIISSVKISASKAQLEADIDKLLDAKSDVKLERPIQIEREKAPFDKLETLTEKFDKKIEEALKYHSLISDKLEKTLDDRHIDGNTVKEMTKSRELEFDKIDTLRTSEDLSRSNINKICTSRLEEINTFAKGYLDSEKLESAKEKIANGKEVTVSESNAIDIYNKCVDERNMVLNKLNAVGITKELTEISQMVKDIPPSARNDFQRDFEMAFNKSEFKEPDFKIENRINREDLISREQYRECNRNLELRKALTEHKNEVEKTIEKDIPKADLSRYKAITRLEEKGIDCSKFKDENYNRYKTLIDKNIDNYRNDCYELNKNIAKSFERQLKETEMLLD